MLDIQLLRSEPEKVQHALAKRGYDVDMTEFLERDKERRKLIASGETLKAKRNRVSGEIPAMKKRGEDITDVLAEMKEVSASIKASDARLA